MDACEVTGGSSSGRKENYVHVALKGEVCVRTDLVKSITSDTTKQAATSGQACCSDPAVFNQLIQKKRQSLPVSLTPSFSQFLSLLSASCHL